MRERTRETERGKQKLCERDRERGGNRQRPCERELERQRARDRQRDGKMRSRVTARQIHPRQIGVLPKGS